MDNFCKLNQITAPSMEQLNIQTAYPYQNQIDLKQLLQMNSQQNLTAMMPPTSQMLQNDQVQQIQEMMQQQQQQQIDPYILQQFYQQQYNGFFPTMFQPQLNAFIQNNNQLVEEPKKQKKQSQTKKRQIQQRNKEQQEIKGVEIPQQQQLYLRDVQREQDAPQNSNILRIDIERQISNQKNENGKRIYRKKSEGSVKRWTKEEALLYDKFIEMYVDIMKDSSSKRNKKIFLLMSKFIGTKQPSQCRSHHQKFFKKVMKQLQNVNKNNIAPQHKDKLEFLKIEEQPGQLEQQTSALDIKQQQKNNPNNIKQLDQAVFGQQNKLVDLSQMPQILDNQTFFNFPPGTFNPIIPLNQGFFNGQNKDFMLNQFDNNNNNIKYEFPASFHQDQNQYNNNASNSAIQNVNQFDGYDAHAELIKKYLQNLNSNNPIMQNQFQELIEQQQQHMNQSQQLRKI